MVQLNQEQHRRFLKGGLLTMVPEIALAQDTAAHHAANVSAIAIPVISVSLNGPLILSYATGVLGVIWYLILIAERVNAWIQRRKAARKSYTS